MLEEGFVSLGYVADDLPVFGEVIESAGAGPSLTVGRGYGILFGMKAIMVRLLLLAAFCFPAFLDCRAVEVVEYEYIVPIAEKDNWDSPNKVAVVRNTDKQKGIVFTRRGPLADGTYNYYPKDTLGTGYNALGKWIKPEKPAATLPTTYSRSITSSGSPRNRYLYTITLEQSGGATKIVNYTTAVMSGFISGAVSNVGLENWVINNHVDDSSTDYYNRKKSVEYVQCIHTDYIYSVTYRPGKDHSSSAVTETYKNNEGRALACPFECPGCTFLGWSEYDGGKVEYEVGDSLPEADCELYAVWSEDSQHYTVKYGGNGADGGNMNDDHFSYHGYLDVPSCMYWRNGYHCIGWSESESGPVQYVEGDKLKGGDSKTITLFAIWDLNTPVEVTLDPAGGVVSGDLVRELVPGLTYDQNGELPDASKTGYAFQCWQNNGTQVYQKSIVPNLAHTLLAKYTPNAYSARLWQNANEGDNRHEEQPMVYDSPAALRTFDALGFARTGYHGDGWSAKRASEIVYSDGEIVSNLTSSSGATVDLYGHWLANDYFVRFDPATNVATGAMSVQSFKYDEEQALAPCEFVRTGYDFLQWKDGEHTYSDRQVVSNLTAIANATNVLAAVWTAKTYRVSFDLKGDMPDPHTPGTPPASIAVTYDGAYGNLPTLSEQPGFRQIGWFTERVGGIEVLPETPVTNASDHVLYAHWKTVPFMVTFDAGETIGVFPGGDFQTNVFYQADLPYGEMPVPAARNGVDVFAGWWTGENGGGVQHLPTNIVSLATRRLRARWNRTEAIDVIFVSSADGFCVTNACLAGRPVGPVPQLPPRDGYRFVGWFTAGGERVAAETILSAKAVCTPRWSLKAIDEVVGIGDLAFGTSVATGWRAEADASCHFGGKPNLRSGDVVSGGASELQVAVPLAGSLGFHWAVSPARDDLECRVNGVTGAFLGSGSSTNSWATQKHELKVTGDNGTAAWCYEPTGNAAGLNRAWIGDLIWTPDVGLMSAWTTNPSRTNLTFSTGGNRKWVKIDEGGVASEVGLSDNQTSWLRATVKGSGVLSFRWRTDCGTGYVDTNGVYRMIDRCEFLAAGNLVGALDGGTGWTTVVITNGDFTVSAEHSYEWRFVKDDTASAGQNRAFLDDVTWTPLPSLVLVTLDPCGGELPGESVLALRPGMAYGTLPEPTRTDEGYVGFGAWYREPTYENVVTEESPVDARDHTLYARWIGNSYTVRLYRNKNNSDSSYSDMAFEYGVPQAITPVSKLGYTYYGHTMVGWKTSRVASEASYADGAVVSNLTTIADKRVSLYAGWRLNRGCYAFESGVTGASGEMPPIAAEHDEDIELPPVAFQKPGHEFSHWRCSDGNEYANGETIAADFPTDGITNVLTAVWIINCQPMTFDAQGGGFTNGTSQVVISDRYIPGEAYGEFPMPTNSADRVFAGWWTSPDPTDRLQQLTNDCVSTEITTLYARWKQVVPREDATVTFDSNGGEGAYEPRFVACGTELGPLPSTDPVREGYRFVGWYSASVGGEPISADTIVTATTNFYARWSDTTVEAVLGKFDGIAFECLTAETRYPYVEETDASHAYAPGGIAQPTLRSDTQVNWSSSYLQAIVATAGDLTFHWALESSSSGTYDGYFVYGSNDSSTETVQGKHDWTENTITCAAGDDARFVFNRMKDTEDSGVWLSAFEWSPVPVVSPIADWATNSVRTNLAFTTGGNLPWTAAAGAIGSGVGLGHGEFSWVRASVNGSGVLAFSWRTDCEGGYVAEDGLPILTDRCEFRCDGALVDAIGGANGWTSVVITNYVGGSHVFEWRYVKDDDASVGLDRAFLDGVTWESLEGKHPVPGPLDRPTIGEFSAGDGRLWLSFDADPRFDYLLRGTNELSAPLVTWPGLWLTNGTGRLTMEPPVDPAKSAMFYCLEVLQKK